MQKPSQFSSDTADGVGLDVGDGVGARVGARVGDFVGCGSIGPLVGACVKSLRQTPLLHVPQGESLHGVPSLSGTGSGHSPLSWHRPDTVHPSLSVSHPQEEELPLAL